MFFSSEISDNTLLHIISVNENIGRQLYCVLVDRIFFISFIVRCTLSVFQSPLHCLPQLANALVLIKQNAVNV